MINVEALKTSIENTRRELNTLIMEGDFEKYYKKSKELDQLIETYIDLEETQKNIISA